MAQVEFEPCHDSSSVRFDSSTGSSRPMSRLQQMQANLHRKMSQEKEEKMVKLYNENQSKAMEKVNLSASQNRGNVRRFFEERRAINLDGSVNLDKSLSSLDSYFLNASNGLIARNSLNSTMQRPKKGSPLGWDKSYPLVPIERTNSGSSSGYESVGGPNRFATMDSARRVPHVRRQSLDRNRTSNDMMGNNMRRSKSQILEGAKPEVDSAMSARGLTARNRTNPQMKEHRFPRDEEKRKLQQEMRRREQELINKIKEQQTEIERMRQEKIKEEKAQKARLYRKPAPPQRSSEKPTGITNHAPTLQTSSQVEETASESKPPSRVSSGTRHPTVAAAGKYRPPQPLPKPSIKKKPPVQRSSTNSDLPECPNCGRRFAADRIEKHISICKKVATKTRKTFDPVKMRTEGTEQAAYLRKGKPAAKAEAKKSNWRQKHESFLQAIRQAKVVQDHVAAGGKLSDLPPPPPMDTSDYVQCPHCQRKFSEGAAERHIPKCQSIRSNKK